jgi:hypothetical protein
MSLSLTPRELTANALTTRRWSASRGQSASLILVTFPYQERRAGGNVLPRQYSLVSRGVAVSSPTVPVFAHPERGPELDWPGTDYRGHVAVFSSGGCGPAPEAVVDHLPEVAAASSV